MNASSVVGRGFRSQISLSGVGSRFWGMEEEMDEVWRDFYATQDAQIQEKLFDVDPKPSDVWVKYEARKKMIHFAWLYNQVASTGVTNPVEGLAERIGCSVEDAGTLVLQCLDLRLLNTPKPGTYRCELSMIAVRMIGKLGIGR